jgi:hypothetical protein
LVKVAALGLPATAVHVPVPDAGVLPAMVAALTLQSDWSVPALAMVTACSTVMLTILEYKAGQMAFCAEALYLVEAARLL